MIKNNNVITLGCRLNLYESEIIKNIIKEKRMDNVVVINTCSVTNEADKQSRQKIRKAKRDYPDSKIIVTGCASQINQEKFESMEEVDFVIGNALKTSDNVFQNIKDNKYVGVKSEMGDLNSKRDDFVAITNYENRTRAFVQIQNGCNHDCTFCIIPTGRGKAVSIKEAYILEQIGMLVDNGYNEVILTGVDLTSYGEDFDNDVNLEKLCYLILNTFPTLPRLRLSSLDVAEISDDFINLLATEKRMVPHIHISLQSGDNMILKRMKRRHSREDVLRFCEKIKLIRPEVQFGSDIIAGFPTETDEMFENTQNLLKEANIIFNHIFSYSAKVGTPAARMPQVDSVVKKERTKKLILQTQKQIKNEMEKMLGNNLEVIIEGDEFGRSANFFEVEFSNIDEYKKGKEKVEGDIVDVKVLSLKDSKLFCEILM